MTEPLDGETPSVSAIAPLCVLLPPHASDALHAEAQHWAEHLGLSLVNLEEAQENVLHLVPTEKGLELWAGARRPEGVARVNFMRRAASKSKASRQPLHRAVGRKAISVVDATAGFGDDSIALAHFGHEVLALEQCSPIAAMFQDARRRALSVEATREAAQRLSIENADALHRLRTLESIPDVVYLDPMYTETGRNTRALPRIEIQVLRRLVGRTDNALELFNAAIDSGTSRIVVKRPISAPPLIKPLAAQHAGKLARYDVYDPRVFKQKMNLKNSLPTSGISS